MSKNERTYLTGATLNFTSDLAGYKPSRTSVDCISLFGQQNDYSLEDGFPLFTTKKMQFQKIADELLWFLSGSTELRPLLLKKVPVWNDNAFQYYLQRNNLEDKLPIYSSEWHSTKKDYIERVKADEEFASREGTLGRIYGEQWRHWRTPGGKEIDQIDDVLELIAKNPSSRRLIVSAWNPGELKETSLPCCCSFMQFYARDGNLDLKLTQRSADKFLGEPWNVASHALLLKLFAEQTNLKPGRFVHSFGDAHFYCGRGERGEFYKNNFPELSKRMSWAKDSGDYGEIFRWINTNAPAEREGEDGLDHVTGILEQLTHQIGSLPSVSITRKPIKELQSSDFQISGYDCQYGPIMRRMAV